MSRKIARNMLRKKYGNKGLRYAWKRYQEKSENGEIRRGQNYSERNPVLLESGK